MENEKRHSGFANDNPNIGNSQQDGKIRDVVDRSGIHNVSLPYHANTSMGGRPYGDVSNVDRGTYQIEGNQQIKVKSRYDGGCVEENNNWTGKPRLLQGTPEKDNTHSPHKQQSPGRMFGTLADINRMYTAGAVLSPTQKGQQVRLEPSSKQRTC